MRVPVLAGAAAAALLALALPSSAAEPAPCAPVEGATVLSLAQPSTQTFDAPVLPGAVANDVGDQQPALGAALAQDASKAVFTYVLDASGSTVAEATRAGATFTLSWGDDSDYDMYVFDDKGRALGEGGSFNPTDGSGETAATGLRTHCSTVVVEVHNYAGLPGEMTLAAKLSGHRK